MQMMGFDSCQLQRDPKRLALCLRVAAAAVSGRSADDLRNRRMKGFDPYRTPVAPSAHAPSYLRHFLRASW